RLIPASCPVSSSSSAATPVSSYSDAVTPVPAAVSPISSSSAAAPGRLGPVSPPTVFLLVPAADVLLLAATAVVLLLGTAAAALLLAAAAASLLLAAAAAVLLLAARPRRSSPRPMLRPQLRPHPPTLPACFSILEQSSLVELCFGCLGKICTDKCCLCAGTIFRVR
ncbi:unnamed protein product, partial [Urochloa humidicola]